MFLCLEGASRKNLNMVLMGVAMSTAQRRLPVYKKIVVT